MDDEDLDGDGIPGFADGFDLDGEAQTADDEYEDELMPLYQLVLSFPTNVGDTPPKIRLHYDASDPEPMAANPMWPDTPFVLPEEGLIRIWRRADTVLDRSAAEARWTSGPQGDFVAPEVGYTEEDLEGEAFDEDGVVTLYIQGVRAGVGTVQFWLDVDGDGPGGFALADEVKYTALDIDIIGNSLNIEGFDPSEALAGAYGPMTAALAEQMGNNPAANPLGMIVIVNDNDDDGDGIVDWADGFNLDGSLTPNADDRAANPTTTPWAVRQERFEKIQIKFEPNPFGDPHAVFYLDYDASPPTSVRQNTPNRQGEEPTYTLPQNGLLRLWTEDGYLARSKDDIRGVENPALDTGYYVGPGWYRVHDWTNLGLNAENNVLTLYVEAVKTAPGPSYTTEITVQLAPDGMDWLPVPVATFTLRPVRIGLDVNDNGSLDDAVDGAMNYLPGYAGGVAVLSTGTTFNTITFQGQQMRSIAEGIGTGSGIDGLWFQIIQDSGHSGYAGNVTDDIFEGVGHTSDFSFDPDTDLSIGTGSLEAGKAWTAFYAKDYGGWAKIRVRIDVGQKSVTIHEFTVPADSDEDRIADRWERDMVRVWNNQYGATETIGPAFFGKDAAGNYDDKEERDPDSPPGNPAADTDGGRNLPPHKTQGDSLTVAQEYRGLVLDGGGFDGRGRGGHAGGHVRLSPVFKEYLWEVDIMAQSDPPAPQYPTPPGGFVALLNAVAADYSDQTGATGLPAPRATGRGAGIHVYWVIDDTSMIHGVFGAPVNADRFAALYRHPLLSSEFVHVLFVDDHRGRAGLRGVSQGYSLIFMRKIANWIVDPANFGTPWDFGLNLRYTVAHETTHLILDTRNRNGFDDSEHEIDPNGGGQDAFDSRFLMFRGYSWRNQNAPPLWSDIAISQIDLTSKEGVER